MFQEVTGRYWPDRPLSARQESPTPGPLARGCPGGESSLCVAIVWLARLVSGHRSAWPGGPALRGLAGRGPHHALPTGRAARGVAGAGHDPGCRKPLDHHSLPGWSGGVGQPIAASDQCVCCSPQDPRFVFSGDAPYLDPAFMNDHAQGREMMPQPFSRLMSSAALFEPKRKPDRHSLSSPQDTCEIGGRNLRFGLDGKPADINLPFYQDRAILLTPR